MENDSDKRSGPPEAAASLEEGIHAAISTVSAVPEGANNNS